MSKGVIVKSILELMSIDILRENLLLKISFISRKIKSIITMDYKIY